MTHKIWKTVGGSSVRRSHMTANRQKVKIDDPFIVGGQRLRVPCDPMASYRETANCRCDVEFVRIEEPSQPFRLAPNQQNPSFSSLLKHYFGGSGQKIYVPITILELPRNLLKFGKNRNKFISKINRHQRTTGIFDLEFRLGYRNHLDFKFGGVSLLVNGKLSSTNILWEYNGLVSATDTFNFDPKKWGDRIIINEAQVRLFNAFAGQQGKEFDIEFTGTEPFNEIGSW